MEIVYTSAATHRFSDQELSALLEQARTNNSALSVSGLLLHAEGSFLQLLEGDERAVDELFERIAQDRRHAGMRLLRRRQTDQRHFAEWCMGFVPTSRLAGRQLPGFCDFLRGGHVHWAEQADPEQLIGVLDGFRGGRYRSLIE